MLRRYEDKSQELSEGLEDPARLGEYAEELREHDVTSGFEDQDVWPGNEDKDQGKNDAEDRAEFTSVLAAEKFSRILGGNRRSLTAA